MFVDRWFQRLSLGWKLNTIVMIVGGTAMLLACAVFAGHDAVASGQRMARDLRTLAEFIAKHGAEIVYDGDQTAALSMLEIASANEEVASAVITLPDGRVLARYDRQAASTEAAFDVDPAMEAGILPWRLLTASALRYSLPIQGGGRTLGTITIASRGDAARRRAATFLGLTAVVMAAAFVVALALSMRLQHLVSRPLLALARTAHDVTVDHRYDIRAHKESDDEVGRLVDQFNAMMDEIQSRDRQLQSQRDDLELEVSERIADLRASNARLVAARDQAMEASRAKSEFLANMSHEIRTPMNGIIGMTELTLETGLAAEQRDYLTTVRTSAESLLTILNDILDFSKIESRKLELESVAFSLGETVDQVMKPLAVAAHRKGLELIVDLAPDLPDAIVGDSTRFGQIVANLVGNAIKFTEHGHVLLQIREGGQRENATELHIRVTDTGVGIESEKQTDIFDAFSQVDGSTTRRFGGTGLGLSISSALVHMMGGRIWVESEVGVGSTFHFTAAFERTAALPPKADPDALAGVKVLIVDDNDVNRRIFLEQLTRWRLLPTVVGSGHEAIEAVTEAAQAGQPFRLMLLDANMPGVSGFEVAARVAERKELAGTTILMLSSAVLQEDNRDLGITMTLTKPVRPVDLFDAIVAVLGRRRAADVAAPPREMPPAADGSRALRVLLAEDNLVNQRVAAGLLNKRGHLVTVASTGREALEALERGAFDLILMDVQMPEMGGLEATQMIREREREQGGHVRIVALTAHAMTGDRERCLASGMDGYLTKPIDRERLVAVVEENSAEEPRVRATEAPAAFDRAKMCERLGGDEQLVLEVIALFLEDCPAHLSSIAVAVERRDAAALRASAHALKGAASNLAAPGLVQAAATLERIGVEDRMDAAHAAAHLVTTEASLLIDALRGQHNNLERSACAPS